MSTVRDHLWIFSHREGSYNNEWGLPGDSRITPAEAAHYLDVPGLRSKAFVLDRARPEWYQNRHRSRTAQGQAVPSAFEQALADEAARKGVKTTEAFARAIEQGRSELRAGNYLLAAQKIGEAYRESKEHPLPPFLIGLACIGMKDYDRASEFLKYSLQCWPEMPKAGPDLVRWTRDRTTEGAADPR